MKRFCIGKLISLLLTFTLVFACVEMVSFPVHAASSGTCGANGSNLTWTLDDEGTLTISGTGAMKNYDHTYLGENAPRYVSTAPWGTYNRQGTIKRVIIEDGVTSIGSDAFIWSQGLTNVLIGKSVKTIASYAFCSCRELTYVVIPDSVTSIGSSAFNTCVNRTCVTIGNGVTSVGTCAFTGCTALQDVYYTGTTKQWNAISIAGSNDSLQNATVHYNSTAPESIPTPTRFGVCGADGDNLTWALDDEGLLTISGTSEMADYRSSNSWGSSPWYLSRSSIETVIIEFNITNIGPGAFYNCTSLTSISIPVSVTSVGTGAFTGCTALQDVYYGGTEKQWNAISIANDNNELKNATIHYYGTFVIGEITVNALEQIEVPVLIGANPGFVSAQVKIGYDTERFTLTEVRDAGTIPGATHSPNLTRNPYTLTWENDTATANQTVEDTTVATLVFTVNDGTPSGDYVFTVIPTSNTINKDMEYVTFEGVNGTFSYTCAHTFEQTEVLTAPTCEESGEATFRCAKCGEEENRELPALGHDYRATQTVAPTCTEQGYTVYVCSHDETHTYNADYTDAIGHDYQFIEYTVAPTCETAGTALYRCSRCQAEESRDADALGHDYIETVIPATYYSEGYTLHVCRHDPSHTYKDNFTPIVDDPTAPFLTVTLTSPASSMYLTLVPFARAKV